MLTTEKMQNDSAQKTVVQMCNQKTLRSSLTWEF